MGTYEQQVNAVYARREKDARIRELEELVDELACATDGCVESTPEGQHFHTASGRTIVREET